MNANNKVASISDGLQTWSFSYDELDNLTEATYPDGGVVHYTYSDPNAPHYLSSLTNKSGQVTQQFTYDMFGRLATYTREGRPDTRAYGTQTLAEFPTST